MGDGAGQVAVVAMFAIGPVLLVMLTSFVKVSVVLALVRNALGTPEVPSGLVVTGLALVLTLFIMSPVIDRVVEAVAPAASAATAPSRPGPARAPVPAPRDPVPGQPAPAPSQVDPAAAAAQPDPAVAEPGLEPAGLAERAWPEGAVGWLAAADRAAVPVKTFLAQHAHTRDRATFASLASRLRGGTVVGDDDLAVLAPAFVTSELAEAFAIGFLVLLPFLVIDLVVGLSLASLGLGGLSPASVALPLKLLLFVAVDGWRLLIEGLVLGYV